MKLLIADDELYMAEYIQKLLDWKNTDLIRFSPQTAVPWPGISFRNLCRSF